MKLKEFLEKFILGESFAYYVHDSIVMYDNNHKPLDTVVKLSFNGIMNIANQAEDIEVFSFGYDMDEMACHITVSTCEEFAEIKRLREQQEAKIESINKRIEILKSQLKDLTQMMDNL